MEESARRGSSPLARGLLSKPSVFLAIFRIIPARAGFTPSYFLILCTAKDHPRSRGVYADDGDDGGIDAGSSPLARGLLRAEAPECCLSGIIPARAGFTKGHIAGIRLHQDHPRSRGVYPEYACTILISAGSSPLARGLLLVEIKYAQRIGIIPARAGFTVGLDGGVQVTRDHPRSRGVYHLRRVLRAERQGSSPLARGLPRWRDSSVPEWRIIPARAGFTGKHQLVFRAKRDHPRSRGVYAFMAPLRSPTIGSSPLARGLRDTIEEVQTGLRIIPARAGFTVRARRVGRVESDHPRSRGVYRILVLTALRRCGSSPLARGLP